MTGTDRAGRFLPPDVPSSWCGSTPPALWRPRLRCKGPGRRIGLTSSRPARRSPAYPPSRGVGHHQRRSPRALGVLERRRPPTATRTSSLGRVDEKRLRVEITTTYEVTYINPAHGPKRSQSVAEAPVMARARLLTLEDWTLSLQQSAQ